MDRYAQWLVLIALIVVACPVTFARENSYNNQEGYAYWDIWWKEQRADRDTSLMLHCGQPSAHPWTRPGNKKLAEKREAKEPDKMDQLMGGLDGGNGGGPPGGTLGGSVEEEQLKEVEHRDGRPRKQKAPRGVLYDYSANKKEVKLPDGVRKVKNGRFGKALKFTGKTGITVELGEKGSKQTLDGWFKPAKLPEKTVCLMASGKNGGRLLLHPDGRVELHRPGTREFHNVSITSKRPIKAGEWTHIAGYVFLFKHIEGGRGRKCQLRLGINGRVAAAKRGKRRSSTNWAHKTELAEPGAFYVGMNADGGQVYTGLMDDLRVASRRRYNVRDRLKWRDPKAEREVPFGPPHFKKNARVFHASFESRTMTVSQGENNTIKYDLGKYASFEDFQVPGPYGKALLIDPTFGPVRIPIEGFSLKEGTFEMWFQPANWDNHTDFGSPSGAPPKRSLIVARIMGRNTKTGEIVPAMTFHQPRAVIHGISDWFHPGQWSHLIWSWSPEDVYKKDVAWGDGPDKGDPLKTLRGYREGEQIWRAVIKRDTSLLGHCELLYLELGIPNDVTVYHGQRPAIIVDEVIGHGYKYSKEEMKKAPKRWKGQLTTKGNKDKKKKAE